MCTLRARHTPWCTRGWMGSRRGDGRRYRMHVGARESLASGGGGVAATRRRGEYLRIHTQTRRGDQREVPAQKSKRCATLAQLRCDSPPHVAVRAATAAARSPPPAARAHARTRTRSALRRRQRRAFTLFIHDFNYIRPFQPLPTRSRCPPAPRTAPSPPPPRYPPRSRDPSPIFPPTPPRVPDPEVPSLVWKRTL